MGITQNFNEPLHNEFEVYKTLLRALCSDIDSDLSMVIKNYLNTSNYTELLLLDVNPLHYTNAAEYYQDKQLAAFIGNYPSWPVSTDAERDKEAIATFIKGEQMCADTNYGYFKHSSFYFCKEAKLLTKAKTIIWDLLGVEPNLQSCNISFGPGATTKLKKRFGDAYTKFNEPTCTKEAVPYIQELLKDTNYQLILNDSALGNEAFTVSKNAKKNRMCNLEPTYNGMAQKAVGQLIRKALNSIGLLLPSAQFHHGEMAMMGSLFNDLVTVDGENASGTVSIAIVHYLFPPNWFNLLDGLRSQVCVVNEQTTHVYEQFSSMGNGFTFELETLIFYALAKAACVLTDTPHSYHNLSVYGDDVIIPTAAYSLFLEGFKAAGFKVNKTKTFHDGPFRESCGADWFAGVPVTPTKVRDTISPKTLTLLYNEIIAKSDEYTFPQLFSAVKTLLVDSGFDNYGPADYSDGHLIDPYWTYGKSFTSYTHKFVGAPLNPNDVKRFNNLNKRHEGKMRTIKRLNLSIQRKAALRKKARKEFRERTDRLKSETYFTGGASLLWFALNRCGTNDYLTYEVHRRVIVDWQLAMIRGAKSMEKYGVSPVNIRNNLLRLIKPSEFMGLKYQDRADTYQKTQCCVN